jgi:hypothetical protein
LGGVGRGHCQFGGNLRGVCGLFPKEKKKEKKKVHNKQHKLNVRIFYKTKC